MDTNTLSRVVSPCWGREPFNNKVISQTMYQSQCTVADPVAGCGGGGEKHEIFAAAFGGHFLYDLFLQGWGHAPPLPPPPHGSATDASRVISSCRNNIFPIFHPKRRFWLFSRTWLPGANFF